MRYAPFLLLGLMSVLVLPVLLVVLGDSRDSAQATPQGTVDLVAIDTDTSGNDDSTVGTIEDCTELASVGDTHNFDLVIQGVDADDRIAGYQVDIDYDPSVICMGMDDDADTLCDEDPVNNIDDDGDTAIDEDPVDATLVDAAGSMSPDDVTMISRIDSSGLAFLHFESYPPYPEGSFTAGGLDANVTAPAGGFPNMHEPASTTDGVDDDGDSVVDNAGEGSGEGVLARITVTAVGTGTSPLIIPGTAGGQDGVPDLIISDGDGDNNLPGDPIPVENIGVAAISVGEPCVAPTPPPVPTPTPTPIPCADSDGDTYSDCDEAFMGTDPGNTCPLTSAPDDEDPDPWPPDLNDDRIVNILDFFQLTPPVFGSCTGDPLYAQRKDLNADGCINISDVFKPLPPMLGQSCTAPTPTPTPTPTPWDTDGDGIVDSLDNCPDTANPGQENGDGDQWGDVCDGCPGTPTPWQTPAGDGDCDGFTDGEEAFVGTDATDACPDDVDDDAWPADLVAGSLGYGQHDGTVNILDIFQLTPPVFGKCSPDPLYTERKDFNEDDCINVLDIFRLTPPTFGQSCTP